ncbi:phage tail tube protein [Salipiger sp. H15]|uniref:Phage tail tube protein n=1 Tax=Alloyangia sp. H15 TaxID=3029062 RepID=A0AAU8AN68_9RHOB
MNDQFIVYGATVERSLDGTTWESIPACKGIAVPTVETDYQEATSLDSADGFKEYVKGLKDAGVISVSCGYTPDGYEQQLSDQAEVGPIYYRTTLPPAPSQSTGDIFEFRGFPTPQVEGNDVGAIVGMTISIRTTGGLDWTRGDNASS